MEFEMDNTPFWCRVFGFGSETQSVIAAIQPRPGLDAVVVGESVCTPLANDKLAIILVADHEDSRAAGIARAFYDAGVLTLVISQSQLDWTDTACDSAMVASPDRWLSVVNSLIYPIYSTDSYISYDLYDLMTTLRNTRHFTVVEAIAGKEENKVAEAIAQLSGKIGTRTIADMSNISLILYSSRRMKQPMLMGHMQSLTDFIHDMPQHVEVVWSVFFDEDMDADTLCLSAIIAGPDV
ncbi:MAG: hypothetical protein HFJ94_01190 [Muribaculaceae bacterium]|nr:hypothetical protein [Muribaculaceae bacterium]